MGMAVEQDSRAELVHGVHPRWAGAMWRHSLWGQKTLESLKQEPGRREEALEKENDGKL